MGIGFLTGFVEEVDLRRAGARFVLRVASAEGLPAIRRRRACASRRAASPIQGGRFHRAEGAPAAAAHASLPGGYDSPATPSF